MLVNIVWRRSSYDQQVHAFRPEQVAEAGRGYLEAICSHSLPPAVLEPVAHVAGPWSALLEPSACLPCLATISDLLTATLADSPGMNVTQRGTGAGEISSGRRAGRA